MEYGTPVASLVMYAISLTQRCATRVTDGRACKSDWHWYSQGFSKGAEERKGHAPAHSRHRLDFFARGKNARHRPHLLENLIVESA